MSAHIIITAKDIKCSGFDIQNYYKEYDVEESDYDPRLVYGADYDDPECFENPVKPGERIKCPKITFTELKDLEADENGDVHSLDYIYAYNDSVGHFNNSLSRIRIENFYKICKPEELNDNQYFKDCLELKEHNYKFINPTDVPGMDKLLEARIHGYTTHCKNLYKDQRKLNDILKAIGKH